MMKIVLSLFAAGAFISIQVYGQSGSKSPDNQSVSGPKKNRIRRKNLSLLQFGLLRKTFIHHSLKE